MSSESSSPNEQPQETVQADSQIKLLLIGDSGISLKRFILFYSCWQNLSYGALHTR